MIACAWLLATACAAPLIVEDGTQFIDVSPVLETLLVPAGGPGWPEVASLPFRAATGTTPREGLIREAWWGRFSVHNPGDQPVTRWLEIAQTNIDELRVFTPADNGEVMVRKAGAQLPFADRELLRRTLTFRIDIPARSTRTIHLHVETQSPLTVPVRLWSSKALTEHDFRTELTRGLLFGLMFAVMLHNLFMFLFSRRRSYALYVVWVTANAAWLASLSGAVGAWFPTLQYNTRFWHSVVASLAWACALLFAREFLDLKSSRPKLGRAMIAMTACIPVTTLVAAFDYRLSNQLNIPLLAVFVVVTTAIGVVRWADQQRSARYFVLGWAWLALVWIGGGLIVTGSVSISDFTLLPIAGVCGEAVLMSLALADDAHWRGRRVQMLQEASSRFVPHRFLALLGHKELPEVRHGEQVERIMTVWFSDIRSFTSTVEGLSAREAMTFVNAYLAIMEPVITRHGGVVDKYIGDAVMALFDDADGALSAAQEALAELDRWNASGARKISIGVGLHTGPLVLGVVGSERRLSCTVLGDSVNLASRVESLTRSYGATLLLSDATRAALQHPSAWTFRQVDRVQVKGRETPTGLLQVLELEAPALRDHQEDFEKGFERYVTGDFAGAADMLARCPGDAAAELLRKRCEALRASPPESWDGVTRLDHK